MANKLNWKAFAGALGIIWGVYLGSSALFASAGIGMLWFSPELFRLLASIYPGLTPTPGGAVIGLFWGLVCGSICGGIFAWLYNLVSGKWK